MQWQAVEIDTTSSGLNVNKRLWKSIFGVVYPAASIMFAMTSSSRVCVDRSCHLLVLRNIIGLKI